MTLKEGGGGTVVRKYVICLIRTCATSQNIFLMSLKSNHLFLAKIFGQLYFCGCFLISLCYKNAQKQAFCHKY
jgi:hypothetical protein